VPQNRDGEKAMTSLHALDQRILDQSLSGGVTLSLPMRPRYNTSMMAKFLNSSLNTGVATSSLGITGKGSVKYNEYWDPDLQSYMYLHDFINSRPEWLDEFAKIALANGVPSQEMNQE
jgi:hypothetical protein